MLGTFKSTLNEKGRLNIPAKLREEIGDSFVIARHIMNKCLVIYSDEEFTALSEKISAAGTKMEAFRRIVFGNANEVETDKQGRVVIPQYLRNYAELEDEILVIGQGKTSEIWNKNNWNNCVDVADTEEIYKTMQELGY